MPGGGVRAAATIAEILPDVKIVMLTVSRDDDDVFEAIRAGAAGYLLKDMDPDRIPHALEGVVSGETVLPRTLLTRVIDEFRTGKTKVLIATNVLARGIDILQVSLVVNYDLPMDRNMNAWLSHSTFRLYIQIP